MGTKAKQTVLGDETISYQALNSSLMGTLQRLVYSRRSQRAIIVSWSILQTVWGANILTRTITRFVECEVFGKADQV